MPKKDGLLSPEPRSPPRLRILTLALLAVLTGSNACAATPGTGAAELEGKIVVGYQGWFGCPGDAGVSGMMHWQGANGPAVEMLPDLSELPKAEQCTLPGGGGAPGAAVYSGSNPAVIDMHFRWMQEYGIAAAAVQRFVSVLRTPTLHDYYDRELREIAVTAARHGRAFFVEYDLSGSTPADTDMIAADWAHLVQLGLTAGSSYQRLRERPLVGLWGLGFAGRPWTPDAAIALIERMRGPERSASVMAGVPASWRTSHGDASADPAWLALWPKIDVLSPWTVGRFVDDAAATRFAEDIMVPDAEWTRKAGVIYLPTAFPGFSWSNLQRNAGRDPAANPRNAIPRRCGAFLRTQLANLDTAGLHTVFVAMFDEVDEGTAIYKVLPHSPQRDYLALDADGCELTSDYYLKILQTEAMRLRVH